MSASGAVIMSLFAALWWTAGSAASGRGSPLMYAVAIAITGGIVVSAWLRGPRATSESPVERARRGRLVGIASGAEGILIFVAINVLANLRRPDLAAPVIATIVGLHFLPLGRWLPAPLYYVTSALLLSLGAAGMAIRDASFRLFAVSAAAACVLWLTSGVVLWQAQR